MSRKNGVDNKLILLQTQNLFCDDISNGSGVIMLTHKQTILKIIPPSIRDV